jgi:hypothetical protein
MDVSSVLIYLKTSEGRRVPLAPIGPQEIMWCEPQHGKEVEEIVKSWRSGKLREYARVPGLNRSRSNFMVSMNRHLIDLWDGKKRTSLFGEKIKGSEIRAKLPLGKNKWKSSGHVVKI